MNLFGSEMSRLSSLTPPSEASATASLGDIQVAAGVTHELKSWPELFEPVRRGVKTHDLRRADDRAFAVGDRLLLQEFDPRMERYSGRTCLVEVTYITSADVPCAYFDAALNPQYCILSIRIVEQENRF